jgi:hypothetical protein
MQQMCSLWSIFLQGQWTAVILQGKFATVCIIEIMNPIGELEHKDEGRFPSSKVQGVVRNGQSQTRELLGESGVKLIKVRMHL